MDATLILSSLSPILDRSTWHTYALVAQVVVFSSSKNQPNRYISYGLVWSQGSGKHFAPYVAHDSLLALLKWSLIRVSLYEQDRSHCSGQTVHLRGDVDPHRAVRGPTIQHKSTDVFRYITIPITFTVWIYPDLQAPGTNAGVKE
jgi:hypothetical protein